MKNTLKRDVVYMIMNHFITHIPSWTIRKLLYRAFGMCIGKGARIAMGVKVLSPKGITIGNNTIINDDCYLDGRGGLQIGSNCSISYRTTIISASHKLDSKSFEYYEASVLIEDNVWIGVNATILDGSFIASGCVLGACAILKGKTEKNGVYLGNPATRKKERKILPETDIKYNAFFR